jgi:hypothetical protein
MNCICLWYFVSLSFSICTNTDIRVSYQGKKPKGSWEIPLYESMSIYFIAWISSFICWLTVVFHFSMKNVSYIVSLKIILAISLSPQNIHSFPIFYTSKGVSLEGKLSFLTTKNSKRFKIWTMCVEYILFIIPLLMCEVVAETHCFIGVQNLLPKTHKRNKGHTDRDQQCFESHYSSK